MSYSQNENLIYRTRKVRVREKDEVFSYCDKVTSLACSLANAVRFRQRQLLTSEGKTEEALTENERSVLDEITRYEQMPGSRYKLKGKMFSYVYLEDMLTKLKNPDRRAEGLPNHTAQEVIKSCVRDMKSFFRSMKRFRDSADGYTGKPSLPGYHRKGGHCSAVLSNQEAVLREEDGVWMLKLPYRRRREQWISFGEAVPGMRLKMAEIIPDNGTYVISIVLEKPVQMKQPSGPERIAAVDPGSANLMAVTNNCGLPQLLYKGGVIKSINRQYSKRTAEIVSEQTKNSRAKFVSTPEYRRTTVKRNDRISDLILKTGRHFIRWCVENRIDTIVMGLNLQQKQNIGIGHKSSQQFVQIPHYKLRQVISYLAEESGIRYIEQEESYTSQASFADNDPLPVYGKENGAVRFSGKRTNRMYVTGGGTRINADLNGSANILRKAFPDAFVKGTLPDMCRVEIIKHPDHKSNPAGIGLCG